MYNQKRKIMNVTTYIFQKGDQVEFELLEPGALVTGTIVGLGVQEESTLGPLYTIQLDEPTEAGESFTMLYGSELMPADPKICPLVDFIPKGQNVL
jgi:hypothetical protein